MTDAPVAADATRGRSFAARHGAALAAGATALALLLILTAFLPRRSLEHAPPPPGRWFDDRAGFVSSEFAPAQFARRPPPSLVAAVRELHLADIVWGVMSLAGIVVGIAFLGLGSEAVMGGHGQLSGAGITAVWSSR